MTICRGEASWVFVPYTFWDGNTTLKELLGRMEIRQYAAFTPRRVVGVFYFAFIQPYLGRVIKTQAYPDWLTKREPRHSQLKKKTLTNQGGVIFIAS